MTNTYDAQYGRFNGGIVNTTLKSGSNDWHGSLFNYYRNAAFDANTTQNNLNAAKKAKHNQFQFGGVAGGPIRKDKDFIFGSFEGWREITPFARISDVPPMAMRDGQHFTDYEISRPIDGASLRRRHRSVPRLDFARRLEQHLHPQSVPRECHSGQPHQPGRAEDPRDVSGPNGNLAG